YGERIYTPSSAAAVQDTYRIGAGHLEVRLDRVFDIAALDGRTIDVKGSVGYVEVVVPTSINATIHAKVGTGAIMGAPVTTSHGGGEQATILARGPAGPHVTINVNLDVGQVSLERVDCPGYQPWNGQLTETQSGGSYAPAACN
ncbi:MAG: hypothetical protein ACRDPG_10495, partial [Nocardioidaceae bacterium]